MKNKLSAFAIVCMAIITFAACKKPVPELALYIPKDASVVFTIDPKSIMNKIASSGITIDSLANLFTKKNDEYALRWNDIKNSGIDLDKSIYFFSKQSNSMQTGKTESSGIIAEIDDVAKLEAFLKKQKIGKDVLSGGKYKYVALGNDFVAGWTDKILILSSVTGGTSAPGTYSTGEGTLSQLQLTTLFTQNEAASIAAADGFSDMNSKTGDMHFYTNGYSNLSALPMVGMSKLGTLMEGSYTTGTVSFDNGKIDASAETHNSKALADMLSKYQPKEIDKDMLTQFPGEVSAFGIIAFNPKILVDVLHYLGFDMMANGYISQMGFTIDDVMNAFSGDIAFVLSDLFIKQNNLPGADNMNAPAQSKYLLIMRIGDKAAFDKVMAGLVNKNILSRNGNQYELGMFGGHDFAIETTGSELIMGSGADLIKTYEAGNNKSNLPTDIKKAIGNKSMAIYVDVNGMLKNMNIHDSSRKTLALAQSTFKNFLITADKSDSKTAKGDFNLNFVNTNENSLASLVKFLTVAHAEDIAKKRNAATIFMDSIPDKNEPEKMPNDN